MKSLKQYHHTAFGSNNIQTVLSGLQYDGYITMDVWEAALHAPFRFDPRHDKEFYDDYWQIENASGRLAVAKKLIRKFDGWYQRSTVLDRIYLARVGLTRTWVQIDDIIDDVYYALKRKYHLPMMVDEKMQYFADVPLMIDRNNINEILDHTNKLNWWCGQINQMSNRLCDVGSAATLWVEFLSWDRQRQEDRDLIRPGVVGRETRKLFNRSYRLFEIFFGQPVAKKFLSGKNLWIKANLFTWRLMLLGQGDLLSYTANPPSLHAPFYLGIYDHEDNRLADCCVLFKNTPILDQAVAIGLSVSQREDELDLLNTTNISNVTEKGRQSEIIKSLPHVNWENHPPFDTPVCPRLNDPTIDDGWASDGWTNDELDIIDVEDEDIEIDLLRSREDKMANVVRRTIREQVAKRLDIAPEIFEYIQFPETGSSFPRIVRFLTGTGHL